MSVFFPPVREARESRLDGRDEARRRVQPPDADRSTALETQQDPSCHLRVSNPESLERAVNRLCSELRVNVYKHLQRYSRQSPHLSLLLQSDVPTDPMCLETSPPLTDCSCKAPSAGKQAKDGLTYIPQFLAVLVAASFGPGNY